MDDNMSQMDGEMVADNQAMESIFVQDSYFGVAKGALDLLFIFKKCPHQPSCAPLSLPPLLSPHTTAANPTTAATDTPAPEAAAVAAVAAAPPPPPPPLGTLHCRFRVAADWVELRMQLPLHGGPAALRAGARAGRCVVPLTVLLVCTATGGDRVPLCAPRQTWAGS